MGLLAKKLPPNMQSRVWIDFMDVIEEESALIKEKILEKKYMYDIDNMDYTRLLEIAQLLGVPFDVSINNSVDFLRQEIKAVPFKIKWKATVKLFKSYFSAIKRRGDLFLYYYDGINLIRNSINLLEDADQALPDSVYIHKADHNYSGRLAVQNKLDEGWKLDEGIKLDNATTRVLTKHFALEIFLDTHFYSGDAGSAPDSGLYPSTGLAPSIDLAPSASLSPKPRVAYLITPEFFSYIDINAQDTKKVTDCIHIGCQLTAITDNSRFYDSYTSFYTMPSILLNCITTDNIASITSVQDMKYIEFGVDKDVHLPSKDGSGTAPTELVSRVARIPILDQEKYEQADWYGVTATYPAFQVNNFTIGTGNGILNTFNKTLDHAPIKPGNIEVVYMSAGNSYTLRDDTFGNLVSTNGGVGTIDYETGLITVATDTYNQYKDVIGTGDNIVTAFSWHTPGNITIFENSIIITYTINGTTYVAEDNGVGVITGHLCTGTTTYSNGSVSLTFTTAPVGVINITYSHRTITTPDDATQLIAKYYYANQDVYITEAGVTDENGNLLAYATFPRIKFKDFTNHLSMGFVIKKSNF